MAKGGSCTGFSGPGERCHPAVSKRHRNTIWQQTWPGKGQRVEAGGVARNVAKAGAAKALQGWKLQGGFFRPW